MRTTYITATVIAIALGVWLYSGRIGSDDIANHPTLADINEQSKAQRDDKALTRVRARVIQASTRQEQVLIRGRTDNKRTVQVRSEISGKIVNRPVERGGQVDQGDLLCEISVDDRQAGLLEARDAMNQAKIEYEGRLKLHAQGLQSESNIAEARARMTATQAQVLRWELDLARTRIRAPFAGTVEEIHQEIGDFLTPGSVCATIVDMNPMLLIGRVSERDVLRIKPEQQAIAILSDGRRLSGAISFVGQQSDPLTRTYAIEIQIPNPDYNLRSGITAEIKVPVANVSAQKVSPGLFTLDDLGRVGIRIVNAESTVAFVEIAVVGEDHDGVWVTGLPQVATLITVGQELVVPGERVEVEYEPGGASQTVAESS
ncbi:MAG: efflux RND transporter periplasmic adaptor subunit [Proteobacteria bacterium]|nr:efflux RND transporter periplasmic adaptor subunit [Pseudomonadota bacterium]